LGEAELLFGKIEDEVVQQQTEKLKHMQEQSKPAPIIEEAVAEVKAQIQYEDFAKLDIKVARIQAAEKVEKADKLLKITLEVAGKEHTVVSGIAQHFAPEDLPGKQVLWLSNLAPRKMRGIESEGMILLAEDADGKLVFVSPEQAVNTGSGVS
jgi:methionyl-tRNA synthetase